MTCSGMRTSSCRHTSTSWLSICGTGTTSDGAKSTVSTICSTVCRWSLSCGLTPMRRSGRAHSVYSSNKSKYTESSLELTIFWLRGASCVTGPAPLNAEWCRAAANSMRTVIRSCRSHERSRRSLLRRAEPTSRSAMSRPTAKVLEMWLTTKGIHTGQDACCCCVVLCCVVLCCVVLCCVVLCCVVLCCVVLCCVVLCCVVYCCDVM